MRVLWLVRGDLSSQPGGDTTQILRTADALRSMSCAVDLCGDSRPDLTGYDVVHLWHLDRLWENLPHARRIRASGIPAVLSTIFWPGGEFDRVGRRGLQGILSRGLGSSIYQNLRLLQRWTLHALVPPRAARWSAPPLGFRKAACELLASMRAILPNSRAEADAIEQTFGKGVPAVIVPNAVSDGFASPDSTWPVDRRGVICVGRIEPRKNQAALIAALRDTGVPLRLVGQAGRFSARYYAQCVRAAGPDVEFVPFCEPSRLRDLYRAARVHVCPSWYETPGLASLEAAACGCAIVVTPGGCTREYFGDDALYARPDDAASIRQAVMQAMQKGPPPGLAQRVRNEYTWQAAARQTLAGYRLALGS